MNRAIWQQCLFLDWLEWGGCHYCDQQPASKHFSCNGATDWNTTCFCFLSGFVNKQNFPYWSATNPKEIYERPLHRSKVTVWCTIYSFWIIGPYFFEDERERAVSMTEPRYVHMLEVFLAPAFAHLPVNKEMFFQQGGATCHTAWASMAVMNNLFPNHVISRYGDIIWPTRSPDLSTCDFFCGGIWNPKFSKLQHLTQFRSWNIKFRKKLNKFP